LRRPKDKRVSSILSRIMESMDVEESEFVGRVAGGDPFRLLIATMLSQNTTDRNAIRAVRELESRRGIEPGRIASAKPEELEELIRPAGLYRARARALIEVSKEVLRRYGGDLGRVLSLPTEEARKELMSLPGVGPKTADVVLLMGAGHPVMPVDTHIRRVITRLGILPRNSSYEEVSKAIMMALPERDYLRAHLSLIAFGREICRAKNPECWRCPLRNDCPSSRTGSDRERGR